MEFLDLVDTINEHAATHLMGHFLIIRGGASVSDQN